MSAQMTAAVSIGLASYTGMPVSTTHVLSSSVAGRCWWMAVVCRKDGDQHSDGLVLTCRQRLSFQASFTGSPETDLSVIRSKRASLLARFILKR